MIASLRRHRVVLDVRSIGSFRIEGSDITMDFRTIEPHAATVAHGRQGAAAS
jgi:hypothetical protein